MRFSVEKAVLHSAIQQVAKVAPARSTLPILNCILFTAEENKLILRTTDLEITMQTIIPVMVEEEGQVAIPARFIGDITGELPETELHFSMDEGLQVELDTEFGDYNIAGKDPEEFPALPSMDEEQTVEMENDILNRLIDKSAFAVSKDELKPALTGVLFQFRPSDTRAVATDGHRLVRCIRQDAGSQNFQGDVIIPTKFLNIVSSNIKSSEGQTRLQVGENHVKVEFDDSVVYTRIIDERFPDYDSVIPSDNDKEVLADIDEMLSTLKRVNIFANKSTHQVTLNFDNNKLTVATDNPENNASAQEELNVQYTSEALTLGFNANYVMDILRHLDTKEAIIKLKSPISAGLIYPSEQEQDEDITMLLMPIRLNE
ncbi:MAG: DNA polymerase III subunit beta [Candidatus Marinimicrobia bacterium]|nr:DNA polymerase III subunit beta [Candidatus Neomarinimicrobiota bacterium]MCF7829126.1 DNA polymerase III subunit beta [Candidatus Neomarinimicrobiota bacterium]MCF7881475.1 DNA polymerase III subunit beta [Candidatus Neomarinimicrobiota bacterium]